MGKEDIAILSPFRRQLALIKDAYDESAAADDKSARPEILTVDEAQGRDKGVVIVSLVKSNTVRKVGHLLKDKRRLNVLLTRAQKKLVLVGSGTTLKEDPLMREMLSFCWEQRLVVNYVKPASSPSRT